MQKEKVFFLAVSAALLLAAMRLLPRRAQPMDPVTLLTASGIHYAAASVAEGDASLTALETAGQAVAYRDDLGSAFLRDAADRAPDALLLTGGLTADGGRDSHQDLSTRLGRIRDAGSRVYVLPGPGDLEGVGAEEFLEIWGADGWTDAVSRDGASLSYAAQVTDQLRVLMLDAEAVEIPGTVPDETLLWIRQQLETARREGIRIVAGCARSVLDHGAEGGLTNGSEVLALYRQYSNVVCALCGGPIQHIAEDTVVEIESSPLLTWPHQIGTLSLEGTTADYAAMSVTVADAVKNDTYQILWNAAYRRAGSDLASGATVASGIDRLCTFFAGVETRWTAGQEDRIVWDDAALREWQERGSVLADHLEAVQAEGARDHSAARFRFP